MNTQKRVWLLDRGRASRTTRGLLSGFHFEATFPPAIWRIP